ncbi:nucleotide-binding domain-containing protein [Calocera cornea HHB12733]|uniref:Nucleotide-binding domain-containing protein n=1 Tax=Calocera cornea HHB12733 TaxID=1353952 RepID=A0A165CCP1_9BASI|nr:nucleotide-binding domain-containing protein [Calocera cornea HHB12733]
MVLVAVVGAGVIGLTTALKIQELGHDVILIAELFPGDEKSARYTSNWAGAHHVSLAGSDKTQLKMERDTFDVMWKMSAPGAPTESLFLRLPQTEYYVEERQGPNPLADFMPNYRELAESELRPGSKTGVTFETITIDTPRYIAYLYSRVLSQGGKSIRAQLQHIQQVLDGAFCDVPDAVVVCAGLGARTLGGIEDKNVYPIRGQTVLIRAPWVRFGRTTSSKSGLWTYIIPRRSGDVILGGTKVDNDWYPKARPETTRDILERTLAIAPEIAPPHAREGGRTPTVEDVESIVIETGCGFRPGRKGGVRLEPDVMTNGEGRAIHIVYHYGHGGYGYQSSWGSASLAVDLLQSSLKGSVKPIAGITTQEH